MFAKIIEAVLGSLVSGLVEHFKHARRDAKLEELGFEKAEVAKLKAERDVMRRTREIDAEVTPKDVEAILADL